MTKFYDTYDDLATAVILQAILDFRSSVRAMYRNPRDPNAIRLFNDVRDFFLNEEDIGFYTKLDGKMIFSRLMAEIPEIFIKLDYREQLQRMREQRLLAGEKVRKENVA